ncbi:unnamed protein product [Rhizophagus irregularis]|nr:unnamed protein product [Rhizophagus irregularis]
MENMDGMIDLLIGSEISRINKGKGRAIKIESNEFNDEQEEEEETKSDDEQEIGDEQAEINMLNGNQIIQDGIETINKISDKKYIQVYKILLQICNNCIKIPWQLLVNLANLIYLLLLLATQIIDELLPNQQASDRSDLVIRVFKLKLKSITHDLFIKAPKDKPRISDDFDKLVCAEIPDEQQQPLLYETVSRGRLNPNLPCIENGKCSKYYPRDFVSITATNKFEYIVYR